MRSTVVILNSSGGDTKAIRDSFSALEEVRCLEFREESELIAWMSEDGTRVDAIFLDHPPAETLRMLKAYPGTADAFYVLMGDIRGERWIEGMRRLNDLVDFLILKPASTAVIRKKIETCLRGQRGGASAMLVDETGDSKSEIVEALGASGISTIYQVNDSAAALAQLDNKGDKISLAVFSWEMPCETSLFILREMKETPRFARIPIIFVTSGISLARVTAVHDYEAGFDGKLLRPFSGRWLQDQMSALVGRLDRHLEGNGYVKEARMFMGRNLLPHAESILEHAMRRLPSEARLPEALGDVLARMGTEQKDDRKLERALVAYESSLRLSRWRPQVLQKCFFLYTKLGRLEDVVRLAKRYLGHFGFDDRLRTWLGKMYLRKGDIGAAQVELRRAVSFNPENADARRMLEQSGASLKGEPW